MTNSDRTHPREETKLFLKVFWHYLKNRWYVVVATTLLAACWVLFVFFRRTDYFESRCAFVMNVNLARVEDDRLQSRDLLATAIDRVDRLKVAHYTDKGVRGKFDMYQESPFLVKIRNFPDHLTQQLISVRFSGAESYQMDIGEKSYSGTVGMPFSEGAIELTLSKTAFWRENEESRFEYQFEVFTSAQLLRQFRSGMRVVHRLDDAERIEVRFQDRNEHRALEFMEALSEVYREDWRKRTQAPYQLHLDRIDAELDVVRAELKEYPEALLAELGRNPFLGDTNEFRQKAWLESRGEEVVSGLKDRQENPEFRLLLESHYRLLADRYEQREQLALKPPNLQMSESPYVVRIQSNGRTLMQMGSLTLLGTFSGLAIVLLISFQVSRVQIPEQMAMGGTWEVIGQIGKQGSIEAEELRKILVGLVRLYRQGKKTIMFTQAGAEVPQSQLVQDLAREMHASGYRVWVIQYKSQPNKVDWDTWQLLQGRELGKLLGSQTFSQTLAAKKEDYDLVLLDLPGFNEQPESELSLFDSDVVVFTLKKGAFSEKNWKETTERIQNNVEPEMRAVFYG